MLKWGGVASIVLAAASAFDLGHHSDVSNYVLRHQMSADARLVVDLQVGMTDYLSQTPLPMVDSEPLEKLHFDNLFSTADNAASWKTLMENTCNAVALSASKGDIWEFLSNFAISLHAVQDFYTHSTWTDVFPRGTADGHQCLRRETWIRAGPPTHAEIVTGMSTAFTRENPDAPYPKHGSYYSGLNKDSYVKGAAFEDALHFALFGTADWANFVRGCVPDTFWSSLATAVLDDDVREEVQDEYRLLLDSFETISTGEDGHYKGPGSGDTATFLSASAKLELKFRVNASPFIKHFTKDALHVPLSDGMCDAYYTCEAGASGKALSALASGALARASKTNDDLAAVVRVRTTSFERETGHSIVDPNYYAAVTVNGVQQRECVMRRTDAASADSDSHPLYWTTLVPLAEYMRGEDGRFSAVPITYSLWDEGNDDVEVSIHPSDPDRKRLHLFYDIQSGELSGDVASTDGHVSVTGADCGNRCERASVTFEVSSIPFCPLE